jgi:hypothetical protein
LNRFQDCEKENEQTGGPCQGTVGPCQGTGGPCQGTGGPCQSKIHNLKSEPAKTFALASAKTMARKTA